MACKLLHGVGQTEPGATGCLDRIGLDLIFIVENWIWIGISSKCGGWIFLCEAQIAIRVESCIGLNKLTQYDWWLKSDPAKVNIFLTRFGLTSIFPTGLTIIVGCEQHYQHAGKPHEILPVLRKTVLRHGAMCRKTRVCYWTLFWTSSYKKITERYENNFPDSMVPNKSTVKRIMNHFQT